MRRARRRCWKWRGHFPELKTAPRRSLLFLAVTGEEEGLLGSDYYAHYPTVPITQIVADINMDEVSFLYDFKDIVPLGGEHSSLGAVADDVARHMGLTVSPDPSAGRSLLHSQRPVFLHPAGRSGFVHRRGIADGKSES